MPAIPATTVQKTAALAECNQITCRLGRPALCHAQVTACLQEGIVCHADGSFARSGVRENLFCLVEFTGLDQRAHEQCSCEVASELDVTGS